MVRSGWSISFSRAACPPRIPRLRAERNDARNQLVAVLAWNHFAVRQVHDTRPGCWWCRGRCRLSWPVHANSIWNMIAFLRGYQCHSHGCWTYLAAIAASASNHVTRADFLRHAVIPDIVRDPASLEFAKRSRVVLRELDAAAGLFARIRELPELRQLRTRRFVAVSQLFERHVQLEDFFEQFGRNVFRSLLADVEAFGFSRYSARCIGSRSVR